MKTRILLLGPLPPPASGPEFITQNLVRGLGQYPDLDVVHLNTQVSRSVSDKGRRIHVKALRGLSHLLRYLWLLLSFRPQIVYLPLTNAVRYNGFLRDALFIVPAWLGRRRVVAGLLGGYCHYLKYGGWRGRLVRAVLGRLSLLTVEGRRLTGLFAGVVPPERLAVVPNGVDDQPFAAARARRPARPAATRRVLFVGMLHHAKGFLDVVRAMPELPGAELVCVGAWVGDEDRAAAMALLREHNLEGRVHFPGALVGDAKHDQFLAADVFAFPTYYTVEGHAMVTVEALAAGLPIVCTDHGALDESLRDGWNGYVVPKRDPHALAARLRELLGDDELRRAMGARSRRLYEQRFTREQFVATWVAAVRGAAGARAAVREGGGNEPI